MPKRRIISLFLALTLMLSMLSVSCFANTPEDTAEAQIQGEGQIKNIIFMIPDGGGDTLMDLADMVKQAGGFDRTKYPNATVTDTTPLTLLSYLAGFETTRSANSSVTDSAAGGTALSSGYKTNNGYVGIDTKKVPKATILEVAQSLGKAVGICTTSEWPHATPASYTAHAESRNDYYNIYKQIENKELDVVLGAGYGKVTEFEGATLDNARNAGYKIIRTPEEAASVVPGDKLWGNVSTNSLPSDISNSADKASLPELTEAAITALSGDEDGFFLMVEGSWVDSGGHNSNAVTTTSEYLAFDECWKIAVEFAKGRTDTIVIGAPDHDTGGMDFPETMTDEVALIQQGTNPSTFTWTGNGNHTARNCPVWVYLPEGVEMMEGLSSVVGDSEATRNNYLIDNTDFAPYMASLMGATMDEVSEELFVDVSTIGAYMPTSNRFVFNNGDKYIYTNTDTYYKDGVAVDMHGKVAVYLGGKFYVPAEMIDEEDWNYVNVEDPDTIEGSGTAADPYLIDSIADYKEFLVGLAGDTYDGAYFRQECDLEFDNVDYGLTDKLTFSGNYDGNGHTITWDIETSIGFAVFPAISGTVSNLGVVGKIKSTATAPGAGIAYNVLSTGKIVNCYSNLDYEGTSFYGIAVKNEGTIHNTYYGGNANVSSIGSAISDGGTYVNCYYVENCGLSQAALGVTEISDSEAKSSFVHTLNGGIARAENDYSVSLLGWSNYGGYPVFESTEPFVTKVRLYPETATIGKGDMFQFDVNVDGRYDYSWAINWSMEPQSELSGTYIDKNGVVHIDANETITSFTVMAKSKANGGVADGSIVTVGAKDERAYPVGSGTKADPYLIRNEADFQSFTLAIIGGEQYKDKYFRQICDIDMAGYPGYTGMGSNGKFYGTYDGYGHVINVNIDNSSSSSSNNNIFPYTVGTIMNLGTTGVVKNGHSSGGICRSLRTADGDYGPGLIINCWSNCEVSGNYGGGIVPTNSGKVINCAAFGTVEYGFNESGSGGVISAGTNVNCYFTDSDYDSSTGSTKISEADAKANLASILNANRESAASTAGISVSDLVYWTKIDGEYPTQTILYADDGTTDSIEILPEEIEIPKGDSRQLAISGGDADNSDVTWTIETSGTASGTKVDEYGYITVDSAETNTSLTVKATLKSDETISATAIITVTKSRVPDGSKDNPYIIANEADFLKFTNNVLGGETYKDKYFLQTANLDMAGYPGYSGMGMYLAGGSGSCYFDGTYNGGGHTINVALEGTDECVFPYTRGLVMNLGTTGTINNEHNSAGIVRSLRAADGTCGPGKIVNCWSSVDVTVPSDKSASGIALHSGSGHVVANCYYIGSLSHGNIISGASKVNCYFVNDNYSGTSNCTKLTEEEMKTMLAGYLNDGIADAASAAGVDESDLIRWKSTSYSPVHDIGGDEGEDTAPDGSKDNPYIIANEADFLKFTNAVLGGETYKDTYFLQTADLDMAGVSGYAGMGSAGKFYGTYNGGGHIINVELEGTDGCLFGYTFGTIMNLGSTGSITNSNQAAGIARSLRSADGDYGPGKIVNCWSSIALSGTNYNGGIAPSNSGSVSNCYFIGTLNTEAANVYAISAGKNYNSYYTNSDYSSVAQSSDTLLTEQQMKTDLAKMLNDYIPTAAQNAGVDEADLLKWKNVANSNPVHITGDEPEVVPAEVEFKVTFGEFSENGETVVNEELGFDGRAVLVIGENDPVYLEEAGNSNAEVSAKCTLEAGTYTFKIRKPGYISYSGTLTVSNDGTYTMTAIPELIAGDIMNDYDAVEGDGIVDIDDFIRILRGFSDDGENLQLIRLYTDINCDGTVNVSDLAIIKNNFGKSADTYSK